MFDRFTDRARRVLVLAADEARKLNHNYLGTEHLLLGLISESEGIAAKALEELNVSLEDARAQVVDIIGTGRSAPEGQPPFTPRARRVLELSFKEALQLGHSYIGTEHILLGLMREGEGVGPQVLQKFGANLDNARSVVLRLLGDTVGGESSLVRPEKVLEWLREGYPIARAIESFGISLEDFRHRVEEILNEAGNGKERPGSPEA